MKKLYSFLAIVVSGLFVISTDIYSQLPGQLPLSPKSIPQFVDPLPHFAGNRVDASGGNLVIRYEPTTQVAVSTGTVLATGTVGLLSPNVGRGRYWGYSVSNDGGNTFTPAHWPAFSIVAKRGTPVNVTYENNLGGETYASVNLIADQTIHWAAPLGMNMMDMTPYTGPVPVVPHLHGGEVASESDGGPKAWFTPGYAITGGSWGNNGTDQNYYYPNSQEAGTLWWHDHALGATRLNVYAGLAGFYFLKGNDEENDKLPGWSGDDLVQEVAPVGTSGVFNVQPYLPEIEIAFQDRMFDTQGGLYYPNLPTNPMVHPFWTPEFIGDVITVNGKTWPYLSVAPRKYRFRLLNGSNARFYEIQLQGTTVGATLPAIVQVGTDGGLLDAPVPITGSLLLAPGERADVVIDFTKSKPGQVWTFINSARAPYPKGSPPSGTTTGRLMRFVVNGKMVSAGNPTLAGIDKSSVPASLRATPLVKLTNFAGGINVTPAPTVKRQLTLNEVMGMGGPLEILVNNSKWVAPITENPTEGSTEIWQIINTTADAHPMHLHLVQFQLLSRQPYNVSNYLKAYNAAFPGGLAPDGVTYVPGVYMPGFGPPLAYNTANTDGAIGGNPAITPYLSKGIRYANLNERGWKDTFIAYPGEITTFIIRYAPTDIAANAPASQLMFPFNPALGPGYVWHCHIIDHEDNEMMRPYQVMPSPARPVALMAKSLSSLGTTAAKGSSLTTSEQVSEKINKAVLDQNYPNPFSGETEIRFTLPETTRIQLTLYNSLGQPVKKLLDGVAPAGVNTVRLDAGNLKGGIYYYQLNSEGGPLVKRMLIIN
jgi:FtsP/CotA-like multicopper oxidase with cupredoxin domain